MSPQKHFIVGTSDPDLSTLLMLALISEGCQVTTVSNGREVISSAVAKVPCAVILEEDLAGLTAEEVTRNLQSFDVTRNVPAIILMKGGVGSEWPAIRLGVDQVLQPPLSLTSLRKALGTVVEKSPEPSASQ